MRTNMKYVERSYRINSVMMKGDGAIRFSSLRYSSLLGRCLRLVPYATGALSHLRLRAFHRRSSLPALCYCIAGNSVAGL